MRIIIPSRAIVKNTVTRIQWKRRILKLLFSCSLLLSHVLSFAQPTQGLVGEWTFDNGSLQDGLGLHNGIGNKVNAATDRFNNSSCAIEFNREDTSTVNFGDVLDSVFMGKEFAISVWVNLVEIEPLEVIIGKYGASACGANERQFSLDVLDGSINIDLYGSVSSGEYYSISGDSIITDTNTWYHVAVNYYMDSTANGGLSKIRMYVDDVRQNLNMIVAAGGPISGIDNGAADLSLGSDLVNGQICVPWGQSFNGRMDDLRIYNRALTAPEVTTLYKHQGSGECAALPNTSFIEELQPQELSIYPNPTTGLFTIESVTGNIGVLHFTDISGATVLSQLVQSNKTLVDLTDLSPGIYFCTLKNENYTSFGKIVKQ